MSAASTVWRWSTRRSAKMARLTPLERKGRTTMKGLRAQRVLAAGVLLIAGLGLGSAVVGGASAEQKPAAGSEIKIDNFSFTPASLTVAVGTAVTWVNHDD